MSEPEHGALLLLARIREALGDDGTRTPDELVEYCRTLRPKIEIDRAYREGGGCWANNGAVNKCWKESRAKRVMEGAR